MNKVLDSVIDFASEKGVNFAMVGYGFGVHSDIRGGVMVPFSSSRAPHETKVEYRRSLRKYLGYGHSAMYAGLSEAGKMFGNVSEDSNKAIIVLAMRGLPFNETAIPDSERLAKIEGESLRRQKIPVTILVADKYAKRPQITLFATDTNHVYIFANHLTTEEERNETTKIIVQEICVKLDQKYDGEKGGNFKATQSRPAEETPTEENKDKESNDTSVVVAVLAVVAIAATLIAAVAALFYFKKWGKDAKGKAGESPKAQGAKSKDKPAKRRDYGKTADKF